MASISLCTCLVVLAAFRGYADASNVEDSRGSPNAASGLIDERMQDDVSAFFTTNLDEMQDAPITFDFPPPSWLKGTLIRNGLGRFEVGQRKFESALDAYGKLASWKFSGNGSASFTTKMIQSDSYRDAVKLNDISPYLFLGKTSPPFNIIQEMESVKNGLDNMNVNVFNYGKNKSEFVVVSDFWKVYTIDPYTLETRKPITPAVPNASPILYPISLSSAHSLPEYGTDNYLTYNTLAPIIPGMKSKMVAARATSSGQREVIASIEVDQVSYMHSFAATENYMILLAVPFFVDPIAIMKNFQPLAAFQWDSSAVTKFYVVNIKTGAVKVLKTENMFFLHTVNAYESDLFKNEIVMDVCTYKNDSSLFQLSFDSLNDPVKRAAAIEPTLKRYTLNLDSGDVNIHEFDVISNVSFVNKLDFPTINENYRFKKYCYVYGVVYSYDGKDFLHTSLVKKDVCTGKKEHTWISPGTILNEAFFVPRPGATEEDDGVLLTPLTSVASNTSTFNVFDAKTLKIISTAVLPTKLPFGTHGRFFDYIV